MGTADCQPLSRRVPLRVCLGLTFAVQLSLQSEDRGFFAQTEHCEFAPSSVEDLDFHIAQRE